MVVLLYDDII